MEKSNYWELVSNSRGFGGCKKNLRVSLVGPEIRGEGAEDEIFKKAMKR